ncbi:MAG: diacylglycerol/lipid kinase family protein [Candidatus Saccharimonadales bacterium]
MKRLMLVYNPRSSRFQDVEREVIEKARHLKGWMLGKFEVTNTDVDDNAARLARVLKDGDLVIAAGGDATATIALNGIMKSGYPEIRFGVVGFGNFNDMYRSFGKLKFEQILEQKTAKKAYPLECIIDDSHFRYGMCYFTIGMFAEACAVFDDPKVRKKLRSKRKKSVVFSILALAKWWMKHHKSEFLPEFTIENKHYKNKSDYVAVNAPSMAKILHGRPFFLKKQIFRSVTGNLASFCGLMRIIVPSVLHQVPGSPSKGDVFMLEKPAKVMIQAEGEYKKVSVNEKIEVKKSTRPVWVITK